MTGGYRISESRNDDNLKHAFFGGGERLRQILATCLRGSQLYLPPISNGSDLPVSPPVGMDYSVN